jgi:hypothetical protein
MTVTRPPASATTRDFPMRSKSTSTGDLRLAEILADRASTVTQLPIVADDFHDSWLNLAECKDVDPDQFHPMNDPISNSARADLAAALAVYDACPVHAACRDRRYDLGAVGSIWGGVYYPNGARGVRPCATRGCSLPVESPRSTYCGFEHEHAVKVGTDAGYKLHRKSKTPPCAACKEGHYSGRLRYDHTGQTGRAAAQRGTRSATPGRRVASA